MPGDMGKAVVIPPDLEEESKQKFKIHQFNLLASDMMSLNRSLPDYRIPGYVQSFKSQGTRLKNRDYKISEVTQYRSNRIRI